MFQNRLTLGYLVLVGLPLVFLVTTLRAGRNLNAAPAVAGDWTIQAADAVPAGLSIYQTGPTLLVTLRDPQKTHFTAHFENGRIAAPAAGFEATLQGPLNRRVLVGSLSSVPFRAIKSGSQER